jgi:hypothetical protein
MNLYTSYAPLLAYKMLHIQNLKPRFVVYAVLPRSQQVWV